MKLSKKLTDNGLSGSTLKQHMIQLLPDVVHQNAQKLAMQKSYYTVAEDKRDR